MQYGKASPGQPASFIRSASLWNDIFELLRLWKSGELTRQPTLPKVDKNSRWFAKTPAEGIAAFDFGSEFDSSSSSEFEEEIPTALCKLYLVTHDVVAETMSVNRFYDPSGNHAEIRVGNLLNAEVPGSTLVGFNRAVGGAFIADWMPCDG